MSTFRSAALASCLLLGCAAHALPAEDVPLAAWGAPPFWTAAPRAATDGAGPAEVSGRSSRQALVLPSSPLPFVAIAPCRQYDSRASSPLLQATPRNVPVTGAPCGIPATAQAAAVNITIFNITGATGNGVFSVGVVSPPATAWINYPPTEAQRANAGAVALTDLGEIIVQVNQGGGFVDFVVDVNGYYAPAGIVNTFNTLSGDVTLSVGTDLTLMPSGQTLTLAVLSASPNVSSTLVKRDVSGNFSAGTITANVAGAASSNVLKTGDMMSGTLAFSSGNINLVTQPSTAASGSLLKNGERFLHDGGDSSNTFVGRNAGNFTMVGFLNVGIGASALVANTVGAGNTAIGANTLPLNDEGVNNTAIGLSALAATTIGNNNTAVGVSALGQATGSFNIAVGAAAGQSLTTGSDNIDIGNQGVAAESGTIRIGTVGTQAATFIAGIAGATAAGGAAVFVVNNGQLGTLTSSARFKDDIRDMGPASDGLLKLRPVSFRYKPEVDRTGLAQYGLVAEEVAEVYPDLVIRDAEGRPETVRYHFLVPMLLNEAQKDRRTIEGQRLEIDDLKARLERLETRLQATH